jgi:hypothetical protein
VERIRSDKLFDQRCELLARVVRLSETDADKGEIDDGIYRGEDGIRVRGSEPEVATGTAVLVVLNLGWGQTQRSSVTLWAQQALGGSLYNKHNRIKRNFVALAVVHLLRVVFNKMSRQLPAFVQDFVFCLPNLSSGSIHFCNNQTNLLRVDVVCGYISAEFVVLVSFSMGQEPRGPAVVCVFIRSLPSEKYEPVFRDCGLPGVVTSFAYPIGPPTSEWGRFCNN